MAVLPVSVRPRTTDDDRVISDVLRGAFGGPDEVGLVERLRRDGDACIELVAIDEASAIVGHILFSRLSVTKGSQVSRAVALAPLSARADVQRRGVGDTLTRAGIAVCRDAGFDLAVVLGHPSYYPRFGFSALLAKLLDAPYSGRPSFMALELRPGALGSERWSVRYARAFDGD